MLTKEQYQQMKATWAAPQYHNASEHIVYNILRRKSPVLGFTPIKNDRKMVSCNQDYWNGYNSALSGIKYIYTANPDGYDKTHRYTRLRTMNPGKSRDDIIDLMQQQHYAAMQEIKNRFMKVFGIELTEELSNYIKERAVKHDG